MKARVHDGILRETANACLTYVKSWHASIVVRCNAARIPNAIISHPCSSEDLVLYLTGSILRHADRSTIISIPSTPNRNSRHPQPPRVAHAERDIESQSFTLFLPHPEGGLPVVDFASRSQVDIYSGPSRNLCLAVLNVVQGKATFPKPPIAIMRAGSRFDSKFSYRGPPFDVRNN